MRIRKAYNPGVRHLATILLLFSLVACKGAGDPEKAVKQYRGWCWSESRPLGDWHLDKAAAEADVQRHLGRRAHHSASVKIWTGDPAVTGAK